MTNKISKTIGLLPKLQNIYQGQHYAAIVRCSEISHLNKIFKKIPAKEFYDGCFTALVTNFVTTNFFFSVCIYYIYRKRITKQKSSGFSKNHQRKNMSFENTTTCFFYKQSKFRKQAGE